jgi:hypothetical protein
VTDAERFRQEAEECRALAATAKTVPDKEAWLRLAADWIKLAENAEQRRPQWLGKVRPRQLAASFNSKKRAPAPGKKAGAAFSRFGAWRHMPEAQTRLFQLAKVPITSYSNATHSGSFSSSQVSAASAFAKTLR